MAEMFTNAAAYDDMMGRWSVSLGAVFADFARVRDEAAILDVGCGTGSLVRALTARSRICTIVGIDPVQSFIDHCRAQFDGARFSFDRGNAMALPYPDGRFDACLSMLVLMFVPDPAKAVAEMRRVTRPGGTVAACTWERTGLEMTTLFWEEAEKLDPGADPPAERARHCNREGELGDLWRKTGLLDVEERDLVIETAFKSFDDFWTPFTLGVGPHGVYYAAQTPERRDAIRQALRSRLIGDGADRPFTLSARSLAVRGVAPR